MITYIVTSSSSYRYMVTLPKDVTKRAVYFVLRQLGYSVDYVSVLL